MKMKCSVINCKNDYKDKSLRFHSIPKREDLRKQWISFCGQRVEKSAKVCSEHFLPEDYDRSLKVEMGFAKYDALKKGVVPTVNKIPVSTTTALTINKRLASTTTAPTVSKNLVSTTTAPTVSKNLVSTTTAAPNKVGVTQKVKTLILPLPANKILDDEKQRKIRPILPAPAKKPAEAEQQHKISTTSKHLVMSTGRSCMPCDPGAASKLAETEKQHIITTTAQNLVISAGRNCMPTDLGCTINYLEHKIETMKRDAEANSKLLEAKIEALKTENSRLQTCSKMRCEDGTKLEQKIDTLRREKFILELAQNKWMKEKAALEMRVKRAEFEQRNLEEKLQTIFTPGQIKKIKIGNKVVHWSEEDISQNFKLYTTSAKMYLMLRKKNYPIPSERTLQLWARKRKIKIEPGEDGTDEKTQNRSKKIKIKQAAMEMIEGNLSKASPNSIPEDEENLAIEVLEDDAMEMITSDVDETTEDLDATTSYNAVEDENDIATATKANDVDEESTISAVEDRNYIPTVTNSKDLDEESTISAVEDEQDIAIFMYSNASDESNPIEIAQDEKPWLDIQEFIIPCSYVPQEEETKRET